MKIVPGDLVTLIIDGCDDPGVCLVSQNGVSNTYSLETVDAHGVGLVLAVSVGAAIEGYEWSWRETDGLVLTYVFVLWSGPNPTRVLDGDNVSDILKVIS